MRRKAIVKLEVLNPVAEIPKQDATLAPRLGDLSGKTIGLLWNAKPSGDIINQFTAELLADKFKDVCFKNYIGSVNVVGVVRHATAEDVDMIAKECDAVIGSLAD